MLLMAEFKDRLKQLRKQRGLTQETLAQELGISRSTIGMYETGKREADYETLGSFANFFNVDMNYLIGLDISMAHKDPNNNLRRDEEELLKSYNELNFNGQSEARKRIRELVMVPVYTCQISEWE